MIHLTDKQAELLIWRTLDSIWTCEGYADTQEFMMLKRAHEEYSKKTGVQIIELFMKSHEHQDWFHKLID